MVLFDDPTTSAPVLTAHEFTLTDGAGHDTARTATDCARPIAETDRRLGLLLDMLAGQGPASTRRCSSSPADHGMAAQHVALGANPARHPERIGMKTVTGEPMIWLRDLDVAVEPAPDGRTARVIVCDNDADASGEKPPIAGAPRSACSAPTNNSSRRCRPTRWAWPGSPTPADVAPRDLVLSVHHPDYNPRHLRLDGTNLAIDLRRALYGRRELPPIQSALGGRRSVGAC